MGFSIFMPVTWIQFGLADALNRETQREGVKDKQFLEETEHSLLELAIATRGVNEKIKRLQIRRDELSEDTKGLLDEAFPTPRASD